MRATWSGETPLLTRSFENALTDDPIAPHVEAIMSHLGEDSRRPGLLQTPKRFAKAMRFLTSGYETDPRSVVGNGVFDAEGDGIVVVRDVEFFSLCEHHVLPFFGHAHVAYLPGRRIIGLSKIPRLVELYARRLQVQERLTEQLADALVQILDPKGVMVLTEARHMCMAMRGVQKQNSSTIARAQRGVFAHDRGARQELFALLRQNAET
jgi:GTP cyclohydrolase I